MPEREPVTELDARFSSPEASAIPWAEARSQLESAPVYWLSTVRGDRPHVTPLLAVWDDGALHFTTGETEQKARNLERNPNCALTTGRNDLTEGLDLVVEGAAVRVTEESRLQRLADAWEAKYTSDWHFEVRDGAFHGDGGRALVFAVEPVKVFGYAKGNYGQTRWSFPARS